MDKYFTFDWLSKGCDLQNGASLSPDDIIMIICRAPATDRVK